MSTVAFIDLIAQGALAIGDGYRAKNAELNGDGRIFLRAAYLQNQGFTLGNPDRFNRTCVANFGPKVAQLGDTVITTKGNSTGRVGYLTRDISGSVYSPHLSYWRSLDATVVSARFLYFWSRGPEFAAQLHSFAYSTDMAPYLSLGDQQRFQIKLPAIEEQRRIAAVLGALDDKIELNRRMNETLEGMARALFRSWFVDFDPVHARAAGEAPAHMPPETAALFPARFGDDGLPEGWALQPLSVICLQSKDSVDPRKHLNEAFEHFSLPAFDKGANPVRETGFDIKSQKLRVPPGSILLSRLNPSIRRTWWPRPSVDVFASVASTEFLVVQSTIDGEAPYLYSQLCSDVFFEAVVSCVTGTSNSHQRVKPSVVLDIQSPTAPESVRAAFCAMTGDWFEMVASNGAESRTLAALRDALLPKLMSGELRVRDAEAMVEGVA
jgi:type I restriction enzyme S subunit